VLQLFFREGLAFLFRAGLRLKAFYLAEIPDTHYHAELTGGDEGIINFFVIGWASLTPPNSHLLSSWD
jgi:hypothetical protein